jgi:cyclic lactone autoinducer peptide
MKKILKVVADAAMVTAKKAGKTASFFGLYQPKEPKSLKK